MSEARAQNSYRVIERLESGGMAEVFRGEAKSLAGFTKPVAIKRVLPHLASKDKFISMFLDEARLCARLSHQNIVQVFDIGHVENTYFIVMEYVDGVNLKGVMEYLRRKDRPMDVGVACFITIQVCNGLQYAHELTDSDNHPLNIVHRDVSPPNVLLSKQGEVKLVDFGLAKAASQVEKTDPGVVKGKFSYLAPETASGKEADAQADVFAAGIMLWEMLTGRRLFVGDSDYQTVTMVQKAVVPAARTFNSVVPDALEKILGKALAREKHLRYRSAMDLAEALSHFVSENKIAFSAFDAARVVRETLEDRRQAKSAAGRADAPGIDRLIQDEMSRFTSLDKGEQPLDTAELFSEIAHEGAQPLDALSFETGSRSGLTLLAGMHARRGDLPPGATEDIDFARMLEEGDAAPEPPPPAANEPPRPPPPRSGGGALAHSIDVAALPVPSAPPPPRPKGLIIGALVVLLVVAVVLGLRAWSEYQARSISAQPIEGETSRSH